MEVGPVTKVSVEVLSVKKVIVVVVVVLRVSSVVLISKKVRVT